MDEVKKLSLAKRRKLEGLCPKCGEFAYPYYLCHEHRIMANVYRVLRAFEKRGWVDVRKVKSGNRLVKEFKWNNTAPIGPEARKYSPETMAKMQLPRLNGKPLTDKLIEDCILKVLDANQCPLTEKEIHKGIKAMKTIGKVIPEKESLIAEYKLIKSKKSKLPRNKRDAVEYRINFLLKRGAVKENELIA